MQSDIIQELQPTANLTNQFTGNLLLSRVELPLLNRLLQAFQGLATEFIHTASTEPNTGRILSQPTSTAGRTLDFVDQVFQLRTQGRGQPRGFFKRRIETLELETKHGLGFRTFPLGSVLVNREPLVTCTMHQEPSLAGINLVQRNIQG